MAKTVEIKIPADIEYKVIGNAFGLLVVSGGLLAGTMVSQGSFEYWQDDLVLLLLLVFLAYRLMSSFVTTLTVYQGSAPRLRPVSKDNIQRVHAAVAQLPQSMNYTPEQVMEEVAKRIEAQKADAARRNK